MHEKQVIYFMRVKSSDRAKAVCIEEWDGKTTDCGRVVARKSYWLQSRTYTFFLATDDYRFVRSIVFLHVPRRESLSFLPTRNRRHIAALNNLALVATSIAALLYMIISLQRTTIVEPVAFNNHVTKKRSR